MDQASAVGACREIVFSPSGLPVHQDALPGSDVLQVLLGGNPVCQLRQGVEVLLLFLPGIGIGHRGRRGSDPRGIDKGEHCVIADLLAQREGFGKVLVRLAGSSVSPGKPTIISVVRTRSGIHSRAFAASSRYFSRV